MTASIDFIVRDEDEAPALLVEVKALPKRSEQWARKMRRNLSVHGQLPDAPFFLLALPDQFFLWTDHSQIDSSDPPSYTIDAVPMLKEYFARAHVSSDQVTGASFELIFRTWLQRIIQSPTADTLPEHSRAWLLDTGLFEAIRNGHVEHSGIPA